LLASSQEYIAVQTVCCHFQTCLFQGCESGHQQQVAHYAHCEY